MPKRNLRIVWRGPKLLASGICGSTEGMDRLVAAASRY
jgi:hypothetical protein